MEPFYITQEGEEKKPVLKSFPRNEKDLAYLKGYLENAPKDMWVIIHLAGQFTKADVVFSRLDWLIVGSGTTGTITTNAAQAIVYSSKVKMDFKNPETTFVSLGGRRSFCYQLNGEEWHRHDVCRDTILFYDEEHLIDHAPWRFKLEDPVFEHELFSY